MKFARRGSVKLSSSASTKKLEAMRIELQCAFVLPFSRIKMIRAFLSDDSSCYQMMTLDGAKK